MPIESGSHIYYDQDERSGGGDTETQKTQEEIEQEDLEKGKNIAIAKVTDFFQGIGGHSGTHLANLESLVLFGPDTSKAKVARWDTVGEHGKFYFRKMAIEPGFKGERYPIRFILNMEEVKKKKFIEKGQTERNYQEWLNDGRNEAMIFGKESPKIFSGIQLTDWPYENYIYNLEGVSDKSELSKSLLSEDEFTDAQRNNQTDKIERSAKLIRKFVVIKMIKIAKESPENSLPIYDNDGNLIWPQQMTYDELKTFAAERDRQEAEQSTDNQTEESPTKNQS